MHQTCDACHGFAVTIWLLDEMLVEGRGGQIWRAATAAPVTGDGCPSCRHPMSSCPAAGDSSGDTSSDTSQHSAGDAAPTSGATQAGGDGQPEDAEHARDAGHAGAVEVCRSCELVWVPPVSVPLLPVVPALAVGAGPRSLDPTHCDTCEAPCTAANQRCRYCRTPVTHHGAGVTAPVVAARVAAERVGVRRSSDWVDDVILGTATGLSS